MFRKKKSQFKQAQYKPEQYEPEQWACFLFFGRNTKGQMVLLGSFLIAIVSLILLLLTQRVLNKTLEQTSFTKQERRRGVLSAVVEYANKEIQQRLISSQGCQISTTLLCPTCTDWKASSPRVFAKGRFQIDIMDENGNPTGRFEAPEDDPRAWVEPMPGNPNLYRMNVVAKICRNPMSGRNKFSGALAAGANTEWGLGVPWTPPCSGAVEETSYVGIVDQSTLGGIYTLYIDRGFYANIAIEESSELSAYDSEELSTAAANSSPLVESIQETGVRKTGATHDSANGCGPTSRTVSAYLQMVEAIKVSDPCARIGAYSAGGVPRGTNFGNRPNPPSLIRPMVADSTSSTRTRYFELQTEEQALRSSLSGLCQNIVPGGYMSLEEVIKHYGANHQPNHITIPPKDRSKIRNLVILTEGSGPGELDTYPEEGGANHLQRAHIYYQESNGQCSGQGFVSLVASDQSVLALGNNDRILNGNQIYQLTGAEPDFQMNPPNLPGAPIKKPNQFLVQSVRDAMTGDCEPIISYVTGEAEHVEPRYPYILSHPSDGTPIAVQQVQEPDPGQNYHPIERKIQLINAAMNNPTSGIRDYPNAISFFLMPNVDLDEKNIADHGFSERSFDIGQIKINDLKSLSASYSLFLKHLDFSRFSNGHKIYGVE